MHKQDMQYFFTTTYLKLDSPCLQSTTSRDMLDVMTKKGPRIATPTTPIKITKFATTGQGIGVIESDVKINSQVLTELSGIKVFLWNAIPGEIITKFQITTQKPHLIEGIALAFENTSSDRTEPKDQQYLSTSPWQILTDESEIEAKSEILTSLFQHLAESNDINSSITKKIKIHKSPKTFFYRNKMEYSLFYDHDTEKIHLAMHLRGTHKKIPITSSSIELPAIFERAKTIVEELNEKHEDARNYQSLLLRANQAGEVSGGLLENGKSHPVFKNLTDTLLGNQYSYSPGGFFQINLPVYEQVLLKIQDFLRDSRSVLDLYTGVGTIGLSVARNTNLTLVEVNASAFGELKINSERVAEETKNPHIKPILAKSEEVLDLISHEASVIVDPPRAGCDESLINKLCEVQPEKIIYLSCNPITQVRDLKPLLKYYNLEYVEGYNFFPHTPHIESLVFLSKKS